MMAKLVLQLQVIVIVLTFVLIVIDHYVCGASEHVRVYRGDNDTFENPNHINCMARNAITFPDTNSGCSRCRCFGRYKTYLRSFDRCVRDNELSFLPVLKNSFMIKHSQRPSMSPICITYDRLHDITAATCNSSDSSQRWIWTRYSQLLHVETLKCIQLGKIVISDSTWNLDLKECSMTEKKQKWDCGLKFHLRQLGTKRSGQEVYVYITYQNNHDTILANVDPPLTTWKRYQSNSGTENEVCYSSYGWCNEFTNSSSVMLALDSKYQKQGQYQMSNFSMGKNCSVNGLEVWDDHYWKHLDNHEFRENIFAISNTMTLADKFLKWNFTRAPSNWTNLIMKLNFSCSGCVLIKLKYSPADYPTSCATTVSSSEAAPTKSPTSAKTAESSNGIVTTSHPPHTKSPTSSKAQQEGESSSVVGIVVGLVVAVLVLCGIILGYFCYKRRKSRLDKTSSNVEINGKGKSSGNTLNPIYSSEDNKNPSLSNDGGIYQEPDGNANAASQECDLYEAGDDHEYDYAKVEQKNKPAPPSEELEYDYAKTDDIKSAVQRAPVRGNDYQNTVIKNKNAATDANEDKETGNDAGPLYQTLEDETAPVYQTLESE